MQLQNKKLFILGLICLSVSGLNAQSSYENEYIKVQTSKPIYKTVQVRIPYEEVVSKPYTVRVACGNVQTQHNTNSLGLDTVIGMGLGVAVGNQIGKGNGRTVAKVVGGLLGGKIANDSRNSSYQTQYCNETRYKDEVITKYDYVDKEKLQGYENIFVYNGKRYTKMSNRPLKRIKVTTTISY